MSKLSHQVVLVIDIPSIVDFTLVFYLHNSNSVWTVLEAEMQRCNFASASKTTLPSP